MILISPERFLPHETETLLCLFDMGLEIYHVRKPNATAEQVRDFVAGIPEKWHSRLVLHYHFELAEDFAWRSFHFNKHNVSQRKELLHLGKTFSYSAHSFDEVEVYATEMEYQFLSPIFDSISKEGYNANFDSEDLKNFLCTTQARVVALGGISVSNYAGVLELGFHDAAVLGTVWGIVESLDKRVASFSALQTIWNAKQKKPFVLCIGGFDPCAGAGVLADIKTIESVGGHGLSVITANTVQTDREFSALYPTATNVVLQQIDVLLKRFNPPFVKVGLVPSLPLLMQVFEKLQGRFIVWDPVLSASAGFVFHENESVSVMRQLLHQVNVITPNWPEARSLFQLQQTNLNQSWSVLQQEAKAATCNILLKGGHSTNSKATDVLLTGTHEFVFESERILAANKHGTGCMLSSAVVTYVALGNSLPSACKLAKIFVKERLVSNTSNLAYF